MVVWVWINIDINVDLLSQNLKVFIANILSQTPVGSRLVFTCLDEQHWKY